MAMVSIGKGVLMSVARAVRVMRREEEKTVYVFLKIVGFQFGSTSYGGSGIE